MKYSKEIKIGFFVVFVLVVSFFVINYLRGKDIFNREIELVSHFEQIDGLAESAPVYIKGYKAGKVTEVVPVDDGFRVVCSVEKVFNIPTDSKMIIFADGLMGGKAVRIDFGKAKTYAVDGTTLESAIEAGAIDAVLGQVGPMLENVNEGIAGAKKLLSDENQAHVARTLANLEGTVNNVAEIAGAVKNRTADIDKFITELNKLSSKLNEIADKVSTTIDGVDKAVGTVTETVEGVNTAVGVVTDKISEADIKGLLESLQAVLEIINNPEGTVGKLLHDGSVYESVDTLLNDIDSLVRKIEENPKKYMKLSVF